MNIKFKNVVIVGKPNATGNVGTLKALVKHLQAKKINVLLEQETTAILEKCEVPTIHRNKLKNNCDLIIVVGGDGSMLNAAKIAALQNIPVIGVNRGYLGFLTDITPTDLKKIDAILCGKYQIEKRFLLKTNIEQQNKFITNNLALNDVVLLSYVTGSMIEFSVYIDEQFVCDYRADGLVIATPTGSTAHALSGGGPILHPALEAITLVPMLSHNLSSRPIVIKNNSAIKIVFDKKNSTDLLVRYDGQNQTAITPGSIINIKKSSAKLCLLHPSDYNYFETLRTKLHWERKN